MIVALEMMAVLVGLMVLVLDERRQPRAVVVLGAHTDNQGNVYVMERMMTTKFPLCVVLMEMAHQMRKRGMRMWAQWVPRLQNEEADALTNGDFRHFAKERRVEVKVEELEFGVMDRLLQQGEDYQGHIHKMRREKRVAHHDGGPKRARLRDVDPWRLVWTPLAARRFVEGLIEL